MVGAVGKKLQMVATELVVGNKTDGVNDQVRRVGALLRLDRAHTAVLAVIGNDAASPKWHSMPWLARFSSITAVKEGS